MRVFSTPGRAALLKGSSACNLGGQTRNAISKIDDYHIQMPNTVLVTGVCAKMPNTVLVTGVCAHIMKRVRARAHGYAEHSPSCAQIMTTTTSTATCLPTHLPIYLPTHPPTDPPTYYQLPTYHYYVAARSVEVRPHQWRQRGVAAKSVEVSQPHTLLAGSFPQPLLRVLSFGSSSPSSLARRSDPARPPEWQNELLLLSEPWHARLDLEARLGQGHAAAFARGWHDGLHQPVDSSAALGEVARGAGQQGAGIGVSDAAEQRSELPRPHNSSGDDR